MRPPGCSLVAPGTRIARSPPVPARPEAERAASPSSGRRCVAEHTLPYACIPAGTRNHLALDLGVDRNDVVGALDAFINRGERRVDLAEVNDRVFVNNVSLGLYAQAVQRAGYREAKIRTPSPTCSGLTPSNPRFVGAGATASSRPPPSWSRTTANERSSYRRVLGNGNGHDHVDSGIHARIPRNRLPPCLRRRPPYGDRRVET